MDRASKRSIVMKSDTSLSMRIFGIAVRSLAIAAFYFTLVSALEPAYARYLAILPALLFVVAFLIFDCKKLPTIIILSIAALYTVLCVTIGFSAFAHGADISGDAISAAVNKNLHSGWAFFGAEYSGRADFLFSSIVALWLGLGSAAIVRKSGLAFVTVTLAVVLGCIIIGLFPAYYGIAALVVLWVGLLVMDRGFAMRSAFIYLGLMAAVFAALAPCVVYDGSFAVRNFRDGVTDAVSDIFYSSDSLPEGELKGAKYLHNDGDEVRLTVTVSSLTRQLYLKGFVGSTLNDNTWQPTDKNKYVENGYQGLLDYVYEGGIPFTQYAKYSALSGSAEKHTVTVKNVSADREYMYAPYGLSNYSVGSNNYDLNIQNGVFGDKTYSYSVFASDYSSEAVIQEQWLLNPSLRTTAMNAYLSYESEYRAFVYDVYRDIDDRLAELIRDKMFGISTDSINNAARLLRTFFEENFLLTDSVDGYGSDFLYDFFGGKIRKANAVYFATAATYAFRALGFPARYVEGYLVSVGEDNDGAPVNITGNRAHAWTEVYFDGMGWLPIEVTFKVKAPDVVDPDNPDNPNPPVTVIPDDPPINPPDDPPVPPDIKPSPSEEPSSESYSWLIALIAISSILLFVLSVVLAATLYRLLVMRKKRRLLSSKGESYGRSAYRIIERDLAFYGGFDAGRLEAYGIPKADTDRFVQLVEKSVYGGYDLSVNERSYIVHYINSVADTLGADGRLKRFVNRYILCLGVEN